MFHYFGVIPGVEGLSEEFEQSAEKLRTALLFQAIARV
jgi:hypothetical protein